MGPNVIESSCSQLREYSQQFGTLSSIVKNKEIKIILTHLKNVNLKSDYIGVFIIPHNSSLYSQLTIYNFKF